MKRAITAAVLVACALLAPPVFAVCDNCGTVADIKTIKKEGEGPGPQVEKKPKSITAYQVVVKMENGALRIFSYGTPTAYKVGDRVKIVDKKLVRQ